MAEYILKDIVNKKGLNDLFLIESKATSTEEIGNDIYYLAKECLKRHNIPFSTHRARQIEKSDLSNFDYIIAMEEYNIRNLKRMFGDSSKYELLLKDRDIEDPWYTGNFEKVFDEISKGVLNLLGNVLS